MREPLRSNSAVHHSVVAAHRHAHHARRAVPERASTVTDTHG